jgi:hypothetical protein
MDNEGEVDVAQLLSILRTAIQSVSIEQATFAMAQTAD